MTFARSEEPFCRRRAMHHHLFQDIHDWAGRDRKVRLTKGTSTFCYPENIPRELKRVFGCLKA